MPRGQGGRLAARRSSRRAAGGVCSLRDSCSRLPTRSPKRPTHRVESSEAEVGLLKVDYQHAGAVAHLGRQLSLQLRPLHDALPRPRLHRAPAGQRQHRRGAGHGGQRGAGGAGGAGAGGRGACVRWSSLLANALSLPRQGWVGAAGGM